MTEETTNSGVNTETTEKQATDTFVPAWKIKADKVKEELGDNEQVFYESDQYFDCLPIARPKDAPNVFPFTSEEPTGFIAPKMDWGNRHWVETASIQQGKDIEVLKNQVKLLKDAGQTASQDNQKITEQVNTISEKTDNYEKQSSQQLGQLLTMVSTLIANSSKPATSQNQTTNN
ncbi:hypothetical protein [Lactobacillus amylovorus]|uniref:hypothetical protein n=1 Tax=Lactobacillus amylovorus TaxID=1604 RepID=UPI002244895D|nr:hypothetical protein [Lactobacillus amylovorus]